MVPHPRPPSNKCLLSQYFNEHAPPPPPPPPPPSGHLPIIGAPSPHPPPPPLPSKKSWGRPCCMHAVRIIKYSAISSRCRLFHHPPDNVIPSLSCTTVSHTPMLCGFTLYNAMMHLQKKYLNGVINNLSYMMVTLQIIDMVAIMTSQYYQINNESCGFLDIPHQIGIVAAKRDLAHTFTSFQINELSKRHLCLLQLLSHALEFSLFIMELQWPEFVITRHFNCTRQLQWYSFLEYVQGPFSLPRS